jgi:hypothetical protein
MIKSHKKRPLEKKVIFCGFFRYLFYVILILHKYFLNGDYSARMDHFYFFNPLNNYI